MAKDVGLPISVVRVPRNVGDTRKLYPEAGSSNRVGR